MAEASGVPTSSWFAQRRYGLFVHMAIASVPAFAPAHEYSEWYWSHLSSTRLDDVVLHPAPMPEVQDWHRRHYGDLPYDDFITSLTMDQWDADEIAELAVVAGAGYVVQTSKHHDGYCFFDSALTSRTTMTSGPRRNPVAELAAATRRVGLQYGIYYSLLDWSHPAYGTAAYVDDYLHPQVMELVERYEPAVLWGDGHWGRPPAYWRSDDLLAAYQRVMGSTGVANDRWGASHHDFATYEYATPPQPPPGAFEVCRGVGYSFGWNRAERLDDHLTPSALIALLTETVAKGGNLLVDLGPRADGSLPAEQADVLRGAGRWVTAHRDVLDGTVPFAEWGDDTTRYTVSPSADELLHVNAVDLTVAARPRFAAITPDRFELVAVDGGAPDGHDVQFDERGLVVRRRPGASSDLAAVYRCTLRPLERPPITVAFPPVAATIAGRGFESITAAIGAASSGDVVEVADGDHDRRRESFPIRVPAGVTLRGHPAAVLDAADADAVVALAGAGAAVRGLTITATPRVGLLRAPTGVVADGAVGVTVDRVTLRQCSVSLTRCDGAVVSGCELDGGSIVAIDSDDVTVRANRQGHDRWGVGIALVGGARGRIVGNDVVGDLTGIRLERTTDAVVDGNRIAARWWGVHLDRSTAASLVANHVDRTMRGVCVTGGASHRVAGNRISSCDTALLLEAGATGVTSLDNTIADCRLDVLAWEADEPVRRDDRTVRPQVEVRP